MPPVAQPAATFGRKPWLAIPSFILCLYFTQRNIISHQQWWPKLKKHYREAVSTCRSGTLKHCWQGRKTVRLLWETVRRVLKMILTALPRDPAVPLPGVRPKDVKWVSTQNTAQNCNPSGKDRPPTGTVAIRRQSSVEVVQGNESYSTLLLPAPRCSTGTLQALC